MVVGMGFWVEEIVLETQVKIANKKRGHFKSCFKKARLELEPERALKVCVIEDELELPKAGTKSRLSFFLVEGIRIQSSCQKYF